MDTEAPGSVEVPGDKPTIRVVVASTYFRARKVMTTCGIAPGSVAVVSDVDGARRLGTRRFLAEEVLWESIPHSFPAVVTRLVRNHIS